MSVNDLIVQGAEPLYFLDYFGCSKLDVGIATDVIKGIAEGCKLAGCALIGGETAEMPGMYQGGEYSLPTPSWASQGSWASPCKDDYDLAGFAVGAVERTLILPTQNIQAGDILLGLPSSGIHSNGFSLVRKILQLSNLTYDSPCPWDSSSSSPPTLAVGQVLLEPTRIYIKSLLPAAKAGLLKGMSHITGGGFTENIPRALPSGLGCTIDVSAWTLPEVFRWLMQAGNVASLEMMRTFNCGIGMVVVVGKGEVDMALEAIKKAGEVDAYVIGEVVEGEGVKFNHLESWADSKAAQ